MKNVYAKKLIPNEKNNYGAASVKLINLKRLKNILNDQTYELKNTLLEKYYWDEVPVVAEALNTSTFMHGAAPLQLMGLIRRN